MGRPHIIVICKHFRIPLRKCCWMDCREQGTFKAWAPPQCDDFGENSPELTELAGVCVRPLVVTNTDRQNDTLTTT